MSERVAVITKVSIERAAYDAEAVAEEIREVGLPAEFADKLVVAA